MKSFPFFLKSFGLGMLLFYGLAAGQLTEPTPQQQSHWIAGGSAGVSFGSGNSFGITIAPRVGYKITPNLEGGFMGSYTNNSSNYFSSNMLGIGPYANYYFFKNYFLSALYQHYFINWYSKYFDTRYTAEENTLYLGGGYLASIGGRAYLQVGAMYNVLYKKNNSYFSSGFMPQIGLVFGL